MLTARSDGTPAPQATHHHSFLGYSWGVARTHSPTNGWTPERRERHRERMLERWASADNREAQRSALKEAWKKDPRLTELSGDDKQRKSKQIYGRALRNGVLVRPDTCECCGEKPEPGKSGYTRIQGHHHKGYDYPLEVQWLCVSCHRKVHSRWTDGPHTAQKKGR